MRRMRRIADIGMEWNYWFRLGWREGPIGYYRIWVSKDIRDRRHGRVNKYSHAQSQHEYDTRDSIPTVIKPSVP
jgi:hypothetical protein